MADRVLLIDYENIQDVDLDRIPADVHVRLVLGGKLPKLPTELSIRAHARGDRFAFVVIRGVQPNACDFYIAFYLGEHLATHPDAECVILSKDKKGFDPLVAHLKGERGLNVRRVNTQKEAFSESTGTPKQDHFGRVVALLRKEKARPLKRKGLDGKLKSWFPDLTLEQRGALLQRLFDENLVAELAGKLTYKV